MSLKSKLILICNVLSLSIVYAVAQANEQSQIGKLNDMYAKNIFAELLEIRRDLFAHPELSGQEKRTSKVVANYLTNLGLEVKTGVGGYGVVGILKGAKPGKGIIWRADMDAAVFEYGEQNHVHNGSSKSKPNVAHVCGHDVHTTIGLGIANTLSQKIEHLAGTVYFIFQPAEENQQGAKAMIADGLFNIIQADEIYAAHVAPSPTGVITTSPDNVFSHSRFLTITFDGTNNISEITSLVNEVLSSIVRIKSPERFTNLLNVVDPKIGLSNPDTIYQDYVLLNGPPQQNVDKTSITFFAELFAANYQDIEKVIEQLEQNFSTSRFNSRFQSIQVSQTREGTYNNRKLINEANQFFSVAFGDKAIQDNYGKIPFASEDFGHFQKSIPGVYFFIGVADTVKGNIAFPHLPGFEVDEKVIQYGVSRFSALIEHRLQN